MKDFWANSGYHLLERDNVGRLIVREDFLRAYFLRPEVAPVEESCAKERALHERLLRNPREAVSPSVIDSLADPDAQESYRIVLAFRDILLQEDSLEASYLKIFSEPLKQPLPPLFIDQLAHVIARSILQGCQDPLRLRAAELLFREQKVTIQDGNIMVADLETVEMYAASGGLGSLGRLLVESQTPAREVSLDVLEASNAELYWERESAFDTVLNISFASDGLDAFSRMLESWIEHFFGIAVSIQPVQKISDERWSWHIGLDSHSTALLNDLYQGLEVPEERMEQLLSLFRMEVKDDRVLIDSMRAKPIYLGLCKAQSDALRLKPQNLLTNMPLLSQG